MDEAKSMIETKTIYRSLKTNFTDKEKLDIGATMGNAIREKQRLQSELDSIKKQYSSDIGKQEQEVVSCAERLNCGWEMRRVECEEMKDFQSGRVLVSRQDSYQLIEERAMTGEERQLGLFDKPAEPGETAGDKTVCCVNCFGPMPESTGLISEEGVGPFCPECFQERKNIAETPVNIPSVEAEDAPGQEETPLPVGEDGQGEIDGLKTPEWDFPDTDVPPEKKKRGKKVTE